MIDLREVASRNRELVAAGHAAQMIAHDIRHPFSVLKNGIVILRSAEDPEIFAKLTCQLLSDLDRSRTKVEGLLSDIMSLGRAFEVSHLPLEIESFVECAIIDATSSYGSGRNLISTNFAHVNNFSGDRSKLTRVVSNIVLNALEAMEGRGQIWISTANSRASSDQIEISIKNSHSSIADDLAARVFDVFFTHKKTNGTGLGLAIVKKIVEAHLGTIVCKNTEKSVEFLITLPASDIAHSTDASKSPVKWQKEFITLKRKIAVVEDNLFIREAWVNAIGADAVVDFSTVEDFLQTKLSGQSALQDISCIVTDMNFEGSPMNGYDLLGSVRKRNTMIPIILASDMDVDPRHLQSFTGVLRKEDVSIASLQAYIN